MKIEEVLQHKTHSGSFVTIGVGEDNRLYVNGKAVVTELKLANLTNFAISIGGFATASLFILELYKEFCK